MRPRQSSTRRQSRAQELTQLGAATFGEEASRGRDRRQHDARALVTGPLVTEPLVIGAA